MQAIPYNNQLKKKALSDFPEYPLEIDAIPVPFYKDYSHHQSARARNHKSYDTLGFRDLLLEHLSTKLNNKVIKLYIITPLEKSSTYTLFAYLSTKDILHLQVENSGNFAQWMSIIFKRNYEQVEKYKQNGQFEIQPELNPNPQFMLIISRGEFSVKWVNSGMLVDEKPFENTGAYLYKNAPKQYNEAKIAKEKANYLKKYINTSGATINAETFEKLVKDYLQHKNGQIYPPKDNESVYRAFEKEADFPFPKELKGMLQYHNGIENTGFLTADEVLEEWTNWKSIYDDVNWMLIDLTGNSHPDGRKTIGMYTTPYWIPFYSTGGGNFLAIDYAPGSKGTSGQIIAFGADEQKIRFIAENLQDFLQQDLEGIDVVNNGF